MKLYQVPQDDENLMEGRSRELCYAVDENGRYIRVLSSGWAPKNAAMLQAWEQVGEAAQEAFEQVKAGRLSPLAYFMARGMFDLKLLSDYTGLSKRTIRAHLDPQQFRRLDGVTLAKYAEAFNMPVEELADWSGKADTLPIRKKDASLPSAQGEPHRGGDE